MKAIKANKVYTINEVEKAGYIDQGFDIQDDDGEMVAYGRGKTVPYEDHAAAVKEIERLQSMVADLGPAGAPVDDEGTRRILLAYAKEHGIDLGRATSVSGIVKKIEEQPSGPVEGGE